MITPQRTLVRSYRGNTTMAGNTRWPVFVNPPILAYCSWRGVRYIIIIIIRYEEAASKLIKNNTILIYILQFLDLRRAIVSRVHLSIDTYRYFFSMVIAVYINVCYPYKSKFIALRSNIVSKVHRSMYP